MPSEVTFYLLAAVVVAGAVGAMVQRNLVRCALSAVAAFAGLAGLYLQLGAEFVGFAQVLVYVGAVAILIVFTVLLTQGGESRGGPPPFWSSRLVGLPAAALVFASIAVPLLKSPSLRAGSVSSVHAPVQQMGDSLMTDCIIPLEAVGLLLTAALIGAGVIAMSEMKKATPKLQMAPPVRKNLEKVSVP